MLMGRAWQLVCPRRGTPLEFIKSHPSKPSAKCVLFDTRVRVGKRVSSMASLSP